MSDPLFCSPDVAARYYAGCIDPHIKSYEATLTGQGFPAKSVRRHLATAAHVGRWMDQRRIHLASLDRAVLTRFQFHLRHCKCNGRRRPKFRYYQPRLERLFDYLHVQKIVPDMSDVRPIPVNLENFCEWMIERRGAQASTVALYQRYLRTFLAELGDNPADYDAAQIRSFMIKRFKSCGLTAVKSMSQAVRTYLKFLAAHGMVTAGMEKSVPSVRHWRLSSLPRYLNAEDVEKVLKSCDSSTVQGLRDHAILLLLARLGLRAGDVVDLSLSDVDWESGTIRVCGKSRRESLLPLPQEVGDTILAYLERARTPNVATDRIFLSLNAPIRPLMQSTTVSGIVRSALERAGIHDPPSRGAHLLRHSAATAMIRSGSTLEAVRDVLRHKSIEMTAHYAKVDLGMLSQVVKPWPGGPHAN